MEDKNTFDEVVTFPDPGAASRFTSLVGLDAVKAHLIKEARLLLNPTLVDEWSKKHHGRTIALVETFRNRTPLFIFGGDVGTGKSSLAETFGDSVARQENISIELYRLSLNSRGSGAVGEMTQLLTTAFKEIRIAAAKGKKGRSRAGTAMILLIDEADALAHSREAAQMHHEDKAGVNALIRGIDSLASEHLPVLIVMCTNRLDALDPAVRRRASDVFVFARPTEVQRESLLDQGLAGIGFSEEQIKKLASATGATGSRAYGCTYSDIVRRLLPNLLLDAFPDKPIEFVRALALAGEMEPTPPFREGSSSN